MIEWLTKWPCPSGWLWHFTQTTVYTSKKRLCRTFSVHLLLWHISACPWLADNFMLQLFLLSCWPRLRIYGLCSRHEIRLFVAVHTKTPTKLMTGTVSCHLSNYLIFLILFYSKMFTTVITRSVRSVAIIYVPGSWIVPEFDWKTMGTLTRDAAVKNVCLSCQESSTPKG